MENTLLWIQKKGRGKKDSLHSLCMDRESSDEDSLKSRCKKLVKRANSHQAIVVDILQSQISKVFLKDLLFFISVHGLHNRTPKHLVSVDEKYLRQCLEFVHVTALSESLNTDKFFVSDSRKFVFECPVAAVTEYVVVSTNAAEQWSLGTLMGSKSMINTLNSPLFQLLGDSIRNENLNRMKFTDAMGSPSGLSISSSYKPDKETPMVQSHHKFGSISVHRRLASNSSSNSTCSDWLSSGSSTIPQGMLQFTWKQGVPHFVFSADDQKEIYEAKLRKIDTKDDQALDSVYLFHLNKGGQKGCESDLELVGKMNVSTNFTLSPNNYGIMETEFILFGNIDIYDKEMYTSSHSRKKNKGLSKKVSKVFRTSPSSRQRTISKFSGSSSIAELCSWEQGGTSLLEANIPPNFELAAIVVKDHLPSTMLDTVGGWGLKFLNKSRANQTTLPCENCSATNGDCSTSMSILIPKGIHGGPRTRNGGPSSLIDRWRSGGYCDCGGWDEGCPLTVLQRRSNNAEVLSQVDMQGQRSSVDLVTQGSNNSSPILRMLNVHDGLHFIHFQQPLSALQSFSIAVAIIHAQSPTLRPKIAQEL